jgi:hypothetical protein
MQKRPRGYFEVSDEEYSSSEFLFIALSMLESRGYPGFFELMSVIKDPTLIMQILRLFYGMTIKVPPIKEFKECLQAAEYAYLDMHKHINVNLPAKGKDIRQFMNITQEEEEHLLEIFDEWCKFMNKQGADVRNYMHINRQNTKKRIDLAVKGQKWGNRKY